MFDDWMLGRDTCLLLADRLRELRPKVAVEFGSGFSTAIMALYCEQLVSLEHNPRLAAPWPCVRICRVKKGRYQTTLPDGVEFALIDGPPGEAAGTVGRHEVLPQLWPHLAEDFELWLDDAKREHEQTVLFTWIDHFPIHVRYVSTEKGLAIITRKRGD